MTLREAEAAHDVVIANGEIASRIQLRILRASLMPGEAGNAPQLP